MNHSFLVEQDSLPGSDFEVSALEELRAGRWLFDTTGHGYLERFIQRLELTDAVVRGQPTLSKTHESEMYGRSVVSTRLKNLSH